MKIKPSYISLLGIVVALYSLSSCNKQDDFLNTKPNIALTVPTSLSDLQALLQDESIFNKNDPSLGEASTDDMYLNSTGYSNVSPSSQKNVYTWSPVLYAANENVPSWTLPYQKVYYANTVLYYLDVINHSVSQQTQYNQIKGTALFQRAIAFYNLVQTFAMPYDKLASGGDLGIPLRLSPDLNIKSTRPTVQACYDQVITDLQIALTLLPISTQYITQPTVSAANAMLARVFLAMGNYNQAFQFADAALTTNHTLVDYNTLTPGTTSLSTKFLAEDIFHTAMQNSDIVSPNYQSITDSTIYRSYGVNDLRKTLFFNLKSGLPYFRGTYEYQGYCYTGLAVDELYLIRAECNARVGNASAAMTDLNTLLITRWKTGTFINYSATSADDALNQILFERRKELLYRGLRWTDLRRLNKESRFAITLTRVVNGTTFTLPPNDPRYAMPIPDLEIQLSGLVQNPR